MNTTRKLMPFLVVALAAIYLAAAAVRQPHALVAVGKGEAPSDRFDIDAFADLPVLYEGRVQPYDSLARNALRIISDRSQLREEFRDPTTDELRSVTQPAAKWLLDVIARPDVAATQRVFRIENEEVLTLLGLKPRKQFRYAVDEFADQQTLQRLQQQAQAADAKSQRDRDAFDNQVLETYRKIRLFQNLSQTHHIPIRSADPQAFAQLVLFYYGDPARDQDSGFEDQPSPLPHPIPPATAGGEWRTPVDAYVRSQMAPDLADALTPAIGRRLDPESNPMLGTFMEILSAYALQDPDAFNKAVAAHAAAVDPHFHGQLEQAHREVLFNRFAPTYHSISLYGVAFVIACLSWLGFAAPLRRSATALLLFVFVFQTAALLVRMDLMDRPFVFVTNLYSSAVFIGWSAVLVALVLEATFRNGLGAAVGAAIGMLTAIIAYGLAGEGDTLEMMQAVLDTNFWLATHVTCVTLGYTAVFVAGFIAVAYIIAGVFTRTLADKKIEKNIARMVYGILCFAVFLSFTGTVLGGIWADQSWGRFWGWDPKENGALMIVLWTALILHARWGGMIGHRGIAVLAVLGNIIVAWSWFGTNMLGVGLHSYGFMDSAYYALLTFVFSQLLIAGIGLVPTDYWASFRSGDTPADAPPPIPATRARA